MGNCCGGSQYGSSDADGEAWPSDRRLSKRGPSKEKMLQEGAKRMSDDAQERAQALFKQYRQRASMINVNQDLTEPSLPASPAVSSQRSEGGTARGRMTERELKMLLHDVEPELFQFVWGLFDTKGDGFVYADDFVAGMALLSTSANEDASFEEQIGACFIMFDTRGDGKLGYSEFRSMLEATVTLNLGRMLQTDAGMHHVEMHMEKEYSKENLLFWQQCRNYRTVPDRLALAAELVALYVRPGAAEEVNLPDTTRSRLLKTFDGLGGAQPDVLLFAAAEDEIFKLMERDAFARFKGSEDAVGAVVDEFFAKADIEKDGYVTFDEYVRWVRQQPQVIVFFSQLAQSILSLLSKSTSAGSAPSAAASPRVPSVAPSVATPPADAQRSSSGGATPGEEPFVGGTDVMLELPPAAVPAAAAVAR